MIGSFLFVFSSCCSFCGFVPVSHKICNNCMQEFDVAQAQSKEKSIEGERQKGMANPGFEMDNNLPFAKNN